MACLWMGPLLLARSFRLQIDGVQRQGEPGEHADHREQRKGLDEPVDAGSDAEAGDDAAQQQEATDSAEVDEPFLSSSRLSSGDCKVTLYLPFRGPATQPS